MYRQGLFSSSQKESTAVCHRMKSSSRSSCLTSISWMSVRADLFLSPPFPAKLSFASEQFFLSYSCLDFFSFFTPSLPSLSSIISLFCSVLSVLCCSLPSLFPLRCRQLIFSRKRRRCFPSSYPSIICLLTMKACDSSRWGRKRMREMPTKGKRRKGDEGENELRYWSSPSSFFLSHKVLFFPIHGD